MLGDIFSLIGSTLWMVLGIVMIFVLYLAFSGVCYLAYNAYEKTRHQVKGYGSLKTVTFGDESSVVANRIASVAAVIALFFLWGVATGSKLVPVHVPAPFLGEMTIEYTATNAAGETDNASIKVLVHKVGEKVDKPETSADGGDGFAKDDAVAIGARRSALVRAQKNDDGGAEDGFKVTAVGGQPIVPEQTVQLDDASVFMTKKGSLSVRPDAGWQMEALFLPPPEAVWKRFMTLNAEGYQNIGLWENVFWSLIRVVIGFALGCIFGIPLGFAMGLNSWMRGWFNPIVEFMRPVPPLALIPLIIIWFGIGEEGKISLLFLAALWIMTIAARAGVSGVSISKVHAAYSLGASKTQILMRVILPNSLPEIFTGARVAMGVCWGTVVAAELVAAEKGAGKMIIAASKFQLTDIVIIGIIIIGVIGYGIDVLMRIAENKLVPWKGKG